MLPPSPGPPGAADPVRVQSNAHSRALKMPPRRPKSSPFGGTSSSKSRGSIRTFRRAESRFSGLLWKSLFSPPEKNPRVTFPTVWGTSGAEAKPYDGRQTQTASDAHIAIFRRIILVSRTDPAPTHTQHNLEKKIKQSATCCQELSRRAQDGLKSTQDAAKTAPRALQTLPRRAQELPRRSQLGPKSAQDPSKTVPIAPKRSPIPPRERPRGLQGSKRPPRPPQERPGRLQDRPRRLKDCPKSAHLAVQPLSR